MKTKRNSAPPIPRSIPTDAQVTARAHQLWEQSGRPENRALEHWLEAERQLGRPAGLHDEARHMNADEFDPAGSRAAEMDREIEGMGGEPGARSATSL